jgi:aquaporin Z
MNTATITATENNIPGTKQGWTGITLAHAPEYLCEAAGLGLFMLSACLFGVLLGHPSSIVNQVIEDGFLRRTLAGIAMGLTAICIIRSPIGQRSGAHMNPAVTIAYWWLGKIRTPDAVGYVVAQFAGGVAGVYLGDLILGTPLRHAAVNYVVTVPGSAGPLMAFEAEALISFLMMSTVLLVSNSRSLSRLTPIFAGLLVATFITFESPLSGMSMNPARTVGSAAAASDWTALWVYFAAPIPAMALAAVLYKALLGTRQVFCAKLDHNNDKRCIFNCRFGDM